MTHAVRIRLLLAAGVVLGAAAGVALAANAGVDEHLPLMRAALMLVGVVGLPALVWMLFGRRKA
jgi:phosphoribosylcarboxyaminoimidazole (NCAIR) mutase